MYICTCVYIYVYISHILKKKVKGVSQPHHPGSAGPPVMAIPLVLLVICVQVGM